MAINSNLAVFHPTILGQTLLSLQYPSRPMISQSATAPVGQAIAGLLSNGGKTVDINKVSKPTGGASAYTGTYTAKTPDAEQHKLNIDKHFYEQFIIDKADQRLSPIQLVQNYVEPFYNSLLDQMDEDVKSEAIKFNAAFAELNSGATKMDNEDFTEAKRILKEREFVNSGLIAVVDAGVEKDLSDIALFHQANTGADGAELQRNGMLGRKFGFDIFVDEVGHSQAASTIAGGTPTTDASAVVGATSIGADQGSGSPLTTAASEGDVLYFGSATGTNQFYVSDAEPTGGDDLNNVYLKEGLRDAVANNQAIGSVSGSSQFLFRRGAISLVTMGMESVTSSPAVVRSTVFDPVNNINFTLSLEETTGGGKVTMETLYGVKNFYPDWGVRYIRGAAEKA